MTIQEPNRAKLPHTRPSITHKREVCGVEIFVIVSFLEGEADIMPAEIFCVVGKHGDIVAGLVDGVCVATSVGLQYGVPWAKLRDKFTGAKFGGEDRGWTDPDTGQTVFHSSILDGIARSVDWCIAERRSITGLDEPPPSEPAQVLPPPPATEQVAVQPADKT
jgi:hypothetical protein